MATDPKCRFGTTEVVASVASSSSMSCFSPVNTDFSPEDPYSAQKKVLEISLNGVDWTTSKQSFTFYDHAKVIVSLLEPEGGPTAGGTEILIHGSNFRNTSFLKCTWDDNVDPALKVNATFLSFNSLRCISPPTTASGVRTVEVALDDYHFTDINRTWTYYDRRTLHVSAVDPIGGPTRGGTLIHVIGTGFDRLGGLVTHGSSAFGYGHPEPYRLIEAGTFCKFSVDSYRTLPGEATAECADTEAHEDVLGQPAYPVEGRVVLSRATSSRHVRNSSCFSVSSTPSLGRLSAVTQGTYVSPNLITCVTPRFAGNLTVNRASLRVHVTLNGDFHDLNALSNSNVSYSIYGSAPPPRVAQPLRRACPSSSAAHAPVHVNGCGAHAGPHKGRTQPMLFPTRPFYLAPPPSHVMQIRARHAYRSCREQVVQSMVTPRLPSRGNSFAISLSARSAGVSTWCAADSARQARAQPQYSVRRARTASPRGSMGLATSRSSRSILR